MFNEKTEEYDPKTNSKIPVWQTPNYIESKKIALKLLKEKDYLHECDFWILMNKTKNGKMAYTGLIISHNGCLKINDHSEQKLKFKPECLSVDKDGFANSLVYIYNCPEQGIYEVGEVNNANCKNAYQYAMALKRCFDRVVLKLSKLAFYGIYADSEADEFKDPINPPIEEEIKSDQKKADEINKDFNLNTLLATKEQVDNLIKGCEVTKTDAASIAKHYGVESFYELTDAQAKEALALLHKRANK